MTINRTTHPFVSTDEWEIFLKCLTEIELTSLMEKFQETEYYKKYCDALDEKWNPAIKKESERVKDETTTMIKKVADQSSDLDETLDRIRDDVEIAREKLKSVLTESELIERTIEEWDI